MWGQQAAGPGVTEPAEGALPSRRSVGVAPAASRTAFPSGGATACRIPSEGGERERAVVREVGEMLSVSQGPDEGAGLRRGPVAVPRDPRGGGGGGSGAGAAGERGLGTECGSGSGRTEGPVPIRRAEGLGGQPRGRGPRGNGGMGTAGRRAPGLRGSGVQAASAFLSGSGSRRRPCGPAGRWRSRAFGGAGDRAEPPLCVLLAGRSELDARGTAGAGRGVPSPPLR